MKEYGFTVNHLKNLAYLRTKTKGVWTCGDETLKDMNPKVKLTFRVDTPN